MAKTPLLELNTQRWASCKVNAKTGPAFKIVADRLSAPAAKARYQAVEKITGVPWWFIAVVHERESSQRWDRSIAQGDPWNKKSTHVPAGRGPFSSWEEAAVDALVKCAPYAARNKDWSIGNALTMLEKYNGLGYYNKGIPSPYIWAGTNQYSQGKYVADGVFSAAAVDSQLGCAGLLKFMGVGKTGTTPGQATAKGTGILALIGGFLYGAYEWGATHWPYFIAAAAAGLVIYTVVDIIKFMKKDENDTGSNN